MVRWPGWVPILIGALAMLLYAESVASPFQYDDWFTVVESASIHVQADPVLPGRPEAFRPVTTGSRVFDHAWALLLPAVARDHPAFWFHLNNVILHGVASALVSWVVRLWWADVWMATLAGLLFAIHPFNAEAVNYISARSSLLAACWELAALGAYTSWRRGLGFGWWVVAFMSAAVALGAKESAVTLPLLLWLVDEAVIAPADGWRARATRLWPWAVLVTGYVAARLFLVADVTGGSDYSAGDRMAALATGLWILGAAARDAWWPWSLTVEHGIEPLHGIRTWLVLLIAALAIVAAVATWRRRRQSPDDVIDVGVFALAWWVAAALPTLALPFITHVALYLENRFYLATVGFAVFGAWLMARAWRFVAPRIGVAVPVATALAVVVGLGAASHARTMVWKSEAALWRDATNKSPDSALAHAMLGAAYLDQHRPDLAIEPLERAVRLDPRYPLAATNLGAAYVGVDRWDDAITQFQHALQIDPDYHQARRNLALAYQRTFRWADAVSEYETLSRRAGERDEDRLLIGALALQAGDLDKAAASLRTVIDRHPDSYPAWFNLGLAEARRGRITEAGQAFQRAVALNSDDPDVYYQRGMLAARAGRPDEAARSFEAALARRPEYFLAHYELARLEDARGRRDAAAEHYQRFVETVPRDPAWESARTEAASWLAASRRSGQGSVGRQMVRPNNRGVAGQVLGTDSP